MRGRTIIVTGTDTDIGKTVFAAALAGALDASYWKPVQAGIEGGGDAETVATLGRVRFVNDSKATNADAAEKALSSFDNIYWIAGGIAKAGGIEPLQPYFNRITKAYLIGAASIDFAHTLKGKAEFELCETLENAVQSAARDAARSAKPNPIVLLSPACASFDQYQNFEVRGEAFAGFVAKLTGITMTQGALS